MRPTRHAAPSESGRGGERSPPFHEIERTSASATAFMVTRAIEPPTVRARGRGRAHQEGIKTLGK
jgi:hypothetical protein